MEVRELEARLSDLQARLSESEKMRPALIRQRASELLERPAPPTGGDEGSDGCVRPDGGESESDWFTPGARLPRGGRRIEGPSSIVGDGWRVPAGRCGAWTPDTLTPAGKAPTLGPCPESRSHRRRRGAHGKRRGRSNRNGKVPECTNPRCSRVRRLRDNAGRP